MHILDIQLIFEWTTLAVSFVFLALRLYIRFPTTIKTLGWDLASDVLVTFGWLFYLEQAVLDAIIIKTTWIEDVWDPKVPFEHRALVNKLWFVENFTYLNCMYCVKASLLILYHQSFSGTAGGSGETGYKDWKCLKRWLYYIDGAVICGWLLYFAANLGICRPMWRIWSPIQSEHCDYWVNAPWYNGLVYGWHCATDILVYILPFFMIRTLHKAPSVKFGLGLTFGVGFISITCAFLLLAAYQVDWPEDRNFFFNDLEQSLAVIAGCLPTLRAIVEVRKNRKGTGVSHISDSTNGIGGIKTTGDIDGASIPLNGKENALPKKAFLTEARQHSDWLRSAMIQEHLTRSEMISMQEDEVLERIRRFSPAGGHSRNSTRAVSSTLSTSTSADTWKRLESRNESP